MTFKEILTDIDHGVDLAAEALDAIAAVTSSPVVKTADEAMAGVRAVLDELALATLAAITPEQVRGDLAKLAPALKAGDDAADALAANLPPAPEKAAELAAPECEPGMTWCNGEPVPAK